MQEPCTNQGKWTRGLNLPEHGQGGQKVPMGQMPPPPPPTHLCMTETQEFRATFFRGGKGRRNFHSLKLNLMEKAMAPHSSTLAWKIPWMEEPWWAALHGVIESDMTATSLSLFTFMHWRRKWQPTPAFLPGESQGWRSLVGCRLWGRTESDTTDAT